MNYLPLVLAVAVICSAAEARREVPQSWTKAGGSYAQYQADAVECAKVGYFRDVANDKPAKQFIRGFETADRLLNLPSPIDNDSRAFAVARTQPSRKMVQVHAIQVGDVERCLMAKGYRKFTLTKAEAGKVASFDRGSDARRRYLFDIGVSRNADPAARAGPKPPSS
jgi:hypothetical protein